MSALNRSEIINRAVMSKRRVSKKLKEQANLTETLVRFVLCVDKEVKL